MKILLILYSFVFMIIGCSTEEVINKDPDFQASLMMPIQDENMTLMVADDHMSVQDRELFRFPDEWEAYVVKWEKNTIFLDEDGTKITEEQFRSHDYHYNFWTKETFAPELSKVLVEDDLNKLIQHYPVYTASQIQLVNMKKENYLERELAYDEGKLAIKIFIGEEIGTDQLAFHDFQKKYNEYIHRLVKNKLQSYSFTTGDGSKRDIEFLGIEEYPAFIVFDHESIILKTYDSDEFLTFLENY